MEVSDYDTLATFPASHSVQSQNYSQNYHSQKAQIRESDFFALGDAWPSSGDSFMGSDGNSTMSTSSLTTPALVATNGQHMAPVAQSRTQLQSFEPNFYRAVRLPVVEDHTHGRRGKRVNYELVNQTSTPGHPRQTCHQRDSVSQKRLECIYRKCTKKFRYLSQMMRHLKSHGLNACSKCFSTFSSAASAESQACSKACSDRRCRRHFPPPGPAPATCQHLKSAKQQLKVLYPLQFANGSALDQSTSSSPDQASPTISDLIHGVPARPQPYDTGLDWSSSNETIPSTPIRRYDSLAKPPRDARLQQQTEDRLKLLEGRFEKTEKTIGDLKRENIELRHRNCQLTALLSGRESTPRRGRRLPRTGSSKSHMPAESLAQAPNSSMVRTLEHGTSSSAFDGDWSLNDIADDEEELQSQSEDSSGR